MRKFVRFVFFLAILMTVLISHSFATMPCDYDHPEFCGSRHFYPDPFCGESGDSSPCRPYDKKIKSFSENKLQNGGFEQGFTAPWGQGQYSENGLWWNNGHCPSKASIDFRTFHSGKAALYIVNTAARAPNVYGTTVQRIAVSPGQLYHITLWAKGKDLASNGAVSIIVDREWKVRPIALPAGTFEWRKFEGTFQLPSSMADIRIISEDKGEAWIDDIEITPVKDAARTIDDIVLPKKSRPMNVLGINSLTSETDFPLL